MSQPNPVHEPDVAERVVLNDFLQRFTADRRARTPRSADEYVAFYPGHENLIRVELARLGAGKDEELSSFGHYELLEFLGSGGFGEVYRARDQSLDRQVALKILKPHSSIDDVGLRRFEREAKIAARLDLPGICAVFETGLVEHTPFIAMRYVEGESLRQRLRAKPPAAESDSSTPGSKRDLHAALELLEKVARTLHAAHEAGVVHRDVKPGNIMLTPSGEPVLLDFGLARDESGDADSLSHSGVVLGTPAYMAPEQFTNPTARAGASTDIWALGVTLYEWMVGHHPFEAATREAQHHAILSKQPEDPRARNPAVSKELRTVILTALEKDPDRRYQSAMALAEDLQAVREHRPIRARRPSAVRRLVHWMRREPAKAALLGTLLVALPVLVGLVTARIKDAPQLEAARMARLEQEKDERLAMASVALSEERHRDALAAFREVRSMEGTSPEAALGLVMAHLLLDEPEAASAVLDAHAALLGEGAAPTLLRIEVLRALGKATEADALATNLPRATNDLDHLLLAELEMGRKEGRRALDHATRALLLSPGRRFRVFRMRAKAASVAGDREATVATAAALRVHWPRSAVAHFVAGFALSRLKDPRLWDDAISAYREAIRLDPGHAPAYSNLANLLRQKGLHDESLAASREAIRLRPGMAWAHANLGMALTAKGLHDEAIAACREAVRLAPKLAAAYKCLSTALGNKGLLDEAIAAAREAIRLDPGFAEAHDNLGTALSRKQLWDEAIASLREAVRLDPKDVLARWGLGRALSKKGLLDEALTQYREAIRLQPDHADHHFNLGCTLEKLGRFEEATAAYREAIRLRPGWARPYPNLGHVLERRGLRDEAIAVYREAIRLEPDDVEAYMDLGKALAQTGSNDEAIATFRSAIRRRPDYPKAHYNLGCSLHQEGLVDEALAAYREAIRLQPKSPKALCNLGLLLRQKARYGESLELLRRGHRIGTQQAGWPYPSDQWVAEAERLADQETRLQAILAGKSEALSAREWLLAAGYAYGRGGYVAATAVYRKAFAGDPQLGEDLRNQHRYNAACSAALAGGGQGEGGAELTEAQRAALRNQALSWLRADLATWRALLGKGEATRRAAIRILRHWEEDPDLSGVRGAKALEGLPGTEATAWRKLWRDVVLLCEDFTKQQ